LPYNGSGTFVREHDWTQDRANGLTVNATRMDTEHDGFATGLSTAITKDGQTTVTADIPMASHKFTGLAAGSAAGDSVRFEQLSGPTAITTKTADFVVEATDWGKTFVFDCDTAAGPLVATLPLASAFGEGRRVRFRLKTLATKVQGGFAERRYGYVNCAGSDRFDDDGPRWDIEDVTDDGNGKYKLDVGQEVQRQLDYGDWAVISGVVGTGGMTEDINEVKQCGYRSGGESGGGELAVVLLDDFVGTYTSGGTITKICTQFALRAAHSWAELESDGVSRWYRVGGTPDTWPEADILIGRNAFYDAGASASNGNRVGWGIEGQYDIPVDLYWDSRFLRPHCRTVVITEVEDGAEVIIRRANVSTDPLDHMYYPNATEFIATPVDKTIIIHATFHNGNSFQGRSGVIVFRTAEEIAAGGSNQGGHIELFTSNIGASGPTGKWWLSSEGKNSVGSKSYTTGQFTAKGADNEPQIVGYPTHATFTSTAVRALATRAGNSAYRLFDGQSNNGTDDEFWVNGVGTVASDGGTAMTTPADYAEMVREWWDQNSGREDRAGMAVCLVRRDDPNVVIVPGGRGHKDSFIRTVRSFSFPVNPVAIIGVVSVNPAVLGASGETRWVHKYVTDAFGRVELEDCETVSWTVVDGTIEGKWEEPTDLSEKKLVSYYTDKPIREPIPTEPDMTLKETVAQAIKDRQRKYRWVSGPTYAKDQRRKVNKKFNPKIPNIPRRERLEWDAVGLLGKLPLYETELMHPDWIVLGEIQPGILDVLVR
jgi:hypothetical protein